VSPEAPRPGDPPPPAGVLILFGSLGLGLLALLLWAGYRLSRSRPAPVRSALPPFQLAPAAEPLPLPLGLRGAPASLALPGAPAEPPRGPGDRPAITTGLVLRSPTAARVLPDRKSGLKRPTTKSDQLPKSRRRDDGRPAAVAAPSLRLDAGRGADALGGSLGLEDLSPAQTSFGASPSASPGGGGRD
jgi:hypothetical protein